MAPSPSGEVTGAPRVPGDGLGTLAEVTPSLAAAIGVPGVDDTLGIGQARAAAVLLVDGLGADLLAAHAADAPALTELARAGRRLDAGFPTTTATSLATLGTGRPSGAHGIVGYSMGVPWPAPGTLGSEGLPERAGPDLVLNTLRWCAHGASDPVDLLAELPPEQVQPLPTVLERAADARVAVTRIAPEFQRRSGLTRAALRGGRFHGISALGDLAAGILDALDPDADADADARALCYAYHADLDMLGHVYGPGSLPWRLQLGVLDRMIASVVEALPSDGVLAVVADHGMVATDPAWRVDVDTTPALLAGVRRVAGEARVRHVHAEPGAVDEVLSAWREELGGRAWVRSRDEAVADGWFGPEVSDAARGRIGDVVAAARGRWALVRSRVEPLETGLVGHHGSLTEAEQQVPLLLARG